jgi:hypothetical protein
MWEWRYSSTHVQSRHWLEVSGQYHAKATLIPENCPGTLWIRGCATADSGSHATENQRVSFPYLESNPIFSTLHLYWIALGIYINTSSWHRYSVSEVTWVAGFGIYCVCIFRKDNFSSGRILLPFLYILMFFSTVCSISQPVQSLPLVVLITFFYQRHLLCWIP